MATGYLSGVPVTDGALSTVGATVFLGIPAYAILERFGLSSLLPRQKPKSLGDEKLKNFTPDTIILHQYERPDEKASYDMFSIKAETMLMIVGATYINDFELVPAQFPGKKLPVYSYNEKLYEGAQAGAEGLVKDGHLKWIEEGVSDEIKAKSKAFRTLIEEEAHKFLEHERWIDRWEDSVGELVGKVPQAVRPILAFPIRITNSLYETAVSRITGGDRQSTAVGNILDTIQKQLSHNMFLLGTPEPTMADAALFGLLASVIYHRDSNPKFAAAIFERENLHNHFRRIREMFWQNWEDTDPPEVHLAKLKEKMEARERALAASA